MYTTVQFPSYFLRVYKGVQAKRVQKGKNEKGTVYFFIKRAVAFFSQYYRPFRFPSCGGGGWWIHIDVFLKIRNKYV